MVRLFNLRSAPLYSTAGPCPQPSNSLYPYPAPFFFLKSLKSFAFDTASSTPLFSPLFSFSHCSQFLHRRLLTAWLPFFFLVKVQVSDLSACPEEKNSPFFSFLVLLFSSFSPSPLPRNTLTSPAFAKQNVTRERPPSSPRRKQETGF